MMFRESSLVHRYRQFFGIPPQVTITEQMVRSHWELERKLTAELLTSVLEHRWETFERCYTHLYRELEWLNQSSEQANPSLVQKTCELWSFAIGTPPQRIYEIGSGQGRLVTALAQQGFQCCATEITRERGEKHVAESPLNLTWHISDGVHLDRFEAPEAYDVVVSDQVIEHLHPEDLEAHLKGAYRILTTPGRYIFRTPQRFSGPYDVSRMFQCQQSQGMHLKEYTYQELIAAVKRSGYDRVSYAFVPRKLQPLITRLERKGVLTSEQFRRGYLGLMVQVERVLSLIPSYRLRRSCATVLKKLHLFSDNVSLMAYKESDKISG